jgi:hypothetical protein
MPTEKTQSSCPGSRDLNRSGKGLILRNFQKVLKRAGTGDFKVQMATRWKVLTTTTNNNNNNNNNNNDDDDDNNNNNCYYVS